MNKFGEDIELSLKAIPFEDKVYSEIFKAHRNIKRIEHGSEFILDTKFHIDLILSGKNGIITFQEKILRYENSHYNTFTMEYMQNRHTGEEGEFFNIGAQFYLSGYFNKNEDGLCKWIIINLPVFMAYPSLMLKHEIKPSTSNANFIAWNYKDIPTECIYKSYNIN